MSLRDRLLSKVTKNGDSDCWEWTAAKCCGYGSISVDGVTHRAHRLSYELFCMPIPAGANVLHRCDNPGCINPEHLFLGTQAQNMSDKVAKGRQPRGSDNCQAKLTETDVRAILASSEKQRVCAERYGVTPKAISLIRAGKRWAHINKEMNS